MQFVPICLRESIVPKYDFSILPNQSKELILNLIVPMTIQLSRSGYITSLHNVFSSACRPLKVALQGGLKYPVTYTYLPTSKVIFSLASTKTRLINE